MDIIIVYDMTQGCIHQTRHVHCVCLWSKDESEINMFLYLWYATLLGSLFRSILTSCVFVGLYPKRCLWIRWQRRNSSKITSTLTNPMPAMINIRAGVKYFSIATLLLCSVPTSSSTDELSKKGNHVKWNDLSSHTHLAQLSNVLHVHIHTNIIWSIIKDVSGNIVLCICVNFVCCMYWCNLVICCLLWFRVCSQSSTGIFCIKYTSRYIKNNWRNKEIKVYKCIGMKCRWRKF